MPYRKELRPLVGKVCSFCDEKLVDAERDLSRVERGSIEGTLQNIETYRSQPAIRVVERKSRLNIPCVMSHELADKIGAEHSWGEVWTGRKVRVIGRVSYNVDGKIKHVAATDLVELAPRLDPPGLDQVPSNFLQGKSPTSYLDELWSGDGG